MAGDTSTVVRYAIDAARSRLSVKAFATGLLSALGHSPTIAARQFGGAITYVPGDTGSSAIEITAPAASLYVAADASERDRPEIERAMRDEVLEAARFPEIAFRSRSVTFAVAFGAQTRVTVVGSLTVHGVTRDQSIEAMVSVDGKGLTASGDFTIRQSDYGIKPVSAAGGTIKLKDELKGSFTIVASSEG